MSTTDATAASADGGLAALSAGLKQVFADLPGLFSDRVELLSLELQRAALTLAQIVALVVAVAILGVTAWFAVWALAITALVGAGVSMAGALLAALLINLAAAAVAVVWIRRLLPRVSLPATRRHLVGSESRALP